MTAIEIPIATIRMEVFTKGGTKRGKLEYSQPCTVLESAGRPVPRRYEELHRIKGITVSTGTVQYRNSSSGKRRLGMCTVTSVRPILCPINFTTCTQSNLDNAILCACLYYPVRLMFKNARLEKRSSVVLRRVGTEMVLCQLDNIMRWIT